MVNQEFKITLRNEDFRVKKISPVDLMAISGMIDFDKFENNKSLVNFCLENCEVKVGETWLPVKTKGREVYQPFGIEEDLKALNEVYMWMLENVIVKTFTKSNE